MAEDARHGRARDAGGPCPGQGRERDLCQPHPRLTLLAPEIVEAILDGRQPAELQLDDLLQGATSQSGSLGEGHRDALAGVQSFAALPGMSKSFPEAVIGIPLHGPAGFRTLLPCGVRAPVTWGSQSSTCMKPALCASATEIVFRSGRCHYFINVTEGLIGIGSACG